MSKSQQLKFFNTSDQAFFQINQEIKSLSRDRFSYISIRLSFLLLGLFFILLTLYYRNLPQLVPFFYSRPWGNEQLADRRFFFILGAVMLILTVFNFILAARNRLENPLISKLFIWTTFIINLMAFISLIKVFTILSVW